MAEYFAMPKTSKIRFHSKFVAAASQRDTKIEPNDMQISQETPEVIIEQCINNDGGQDEAERLQSSKVALENCSNNEDSDGQEVADTSDV